MCSARNMRQRPLKVHLSPTQKMSKALEKLQHKKMIKKLVIETARKHGIEINDPEGSDAAK